MVVVVLCGVEQFESPLSELARTTRHQTDQRIFSKHGTRTRIVLVVGTEKGVSQR